MPPKTVFGATAWTDEEKFVLLCKVLFREGAVPNYSDITMPGRSHKAVGNVLREFKTKYGPESVLAKQYDGEGESAEKPAPKKRASKDDSPAKGAKKTKISGDIVKIEVQEEELTEV